MHDLPQSHDASGAVVNTAAQHHMSDDRNWLFGVACMAVAVLAAGWFAPVILVGLLVLVMLGGAVAILVVLPLFLRKFVRENTAENGFLHVWQPTLWQATVAVVMTLLSWIPFGVASVLLFSANGVLVRFLAALVEGGLRKSIEQTGELGESVDAMQASPSFFIRILPGDSAELLSSLSAGVKGSEQMLQHLLAVVIFLLILEGIFGWIFLVWLTIRSVLYLLARRIVAEAHEADASQARSRGAVTHFHMGFFR